MLSSKLSGKLFALNRWPSQDHLDPRYFMLTLFAAIMLHLGAFYIWSLMPRVQVVDVPVHALNIKLSDGDEMTSDEMKAIEPGVTSNSATVESTVSHLVQDEQAQDRARQQSVAASMDKAMSAMDKQPTQVPVETTAPTAPTAPAQKTTAAPAKPASPSKAVVKGKFSIRNEGTNVAAPVLPVQARQFVRDDTAQQTADNQIETPPASNNAHDAEMISHYEQLISQWIQKFKIYPPEARAKGMEGETVVRIRLDRHGNIRYYVLEHSTGHPQLDHAAIDMIRRANPVPAVPTDYPHGDLMEFLIPVSFHLQP